MSIGFPGLDQCRAAIFNLPSLLVSKLGLPLRVPQVSSPETSYPRTRPGSPPLPLSLSLSSPFGTHGAQFYLELDTCQTAAPPSPPSAVEPSSCGGRVGEEQPHVGLSWRLSFLFFGLTSSIHVKSSTSTPHTHPALPRPRPHIRPTTRLRGAPLAPPLRSAPQLSRPPPPFRTPPTHDSVPLPSPCSLKSPATHTFFFVGLTKGRTAEAVEARRGQFSTSRSRWVVSDTIGTVPRLLVLRFT